MSKDIEGQNVYGQYGEEYGTYVLIDQDDDEIGGLEESTHPATGEPCWVVTWGNISQGFTRRFATRDEAWAFIEKNHEAMAAYEPIA